MVFQEDILLVYVEADLVRRDVVDEEYVPEVEGC